MEFSHPWPILCHIIKHLDSSWATTNKKTKNLKLGELYLHFMTSFPPKKAKGSEFLCKLIPLNFREEISKKNHWTWFIVEDEVLKVLFRLSYGGWRYLTIAYHCQLQCPKNSKVDFFRVDWGSDQNPIPVIPGGIDWSNFDDINSLKETGLVKQPTNN